MGNMCHYYLFRKFLRTTFFTDFLQLMSRIQIVNSAENFTSLELFSLSILYQTLLLKLFHLYGISIFSIYLSSHSQAKKALSSSLSFHRCHYHRYSYHQNPIQLFLLDVRNMCLLRPYWTLNWKNIHFRNYHFIFYDRIIPFLFSVQ